MIQGARCIDTRNGGQTCRQCRHFEPEHVRKDMLFGRLTESCWCNEFDCRITDINAGQECQAFIKTVFERKG